MLTIIIPVYNEIKTIEQIIDKINQINFIKKEIILVDDFSLDGTRELIKKKLYKKVDKVFFHSENSGKGAAIKTAKKNIEGQYVIIQDGDLEYDPNDYKKLIEPLQKNLTNVVYGSRVLGKNRYYENNFSSNIRVFCNHLLTILSNIINNQKLSDAHTCYKVFKAETFNKINLKENSFSFCPEVTTKLAKMNENILEIPISYYGRTYEDGKKIKFVDGIIAIFALLKYRFFDKNEK